MGGCKVLALIPSPPDTHRPETTTTAAVKASERVWGREFRTSGDVVVLLGVVCTALYMALFALIMQLDA